MATGPYGTARPASSRPPAWKVPAAANVKVATSPAKVTPAGSPWAAARRIGTTDPDPGGAAAAGGAGGAGGSCGICSASLISASVMARVRSPIS